jgi:predicted esterase
MTYTTETSQGRDFHINQPATGTTKAVIFCHGYEGNGAALKAQLGSPDPSSYYLVFPNGVVINPTKPQERQFRSENTLGSLAEFGYFAEIIIHLINLGVTDITIAGYSNGARMAYLLMAKFPEYFKGAFCVSNFLVSGVTPINSDAPIRHIHGAVDSTVPPTDIVPNMVKFTANGHNDSETLIINQGHDLADLNTDNLIMNALAIFIGV